MSSRGPRIDRILRTAILPSVVLLLLTHCATPSTTTQPTKGSASGFTIRGVVADVSPSARVIWLQEPVQGFAAIALTAEATLTAADGSELLLRDLRPGMTVQASGEAGESDALLAREVIVLDSSPASHTRAPTAIPNTLGAALPLPATCTPCVLKAKG